MPPPFVYYREFAPCVALQDYVRAFFSFAPPGEQPSGNRRLLREVRLGVSDPFCPRTIADGHISLTFSFEQAWARRGGWRQARSDLRGTVVGPMSAAGAATIEESPEAVGVFLRAGHGWAITGAPSIELADRIVPLADLWGPAATSLSAELAAAGEADRIDRLEQIPLRRLAEARDRTTPLDVPGLARHILSERGLVRIEQLAEAAGVSRQHLTRSFRESVGVPPKLFARLARFRAGLACAVRGLNPDWAQTALDLGYADQSHMIAEFREFTTLTPGILSRDRWFHPFLERARHRGFAANSRVP